MKESINHSSILFTILLFIVLLFVGSILFNSVSRDVGVNDFSIKNSEGNMFIEESDSFKTISLRWYYQGLHTISLPIPQSEYYHFSSKSRSSSKEYGYYVQDDSAIMSSLSKKLVDIAATESYSSTETISFIAAFVQSLKGTPDYFDDYPQFPVETIYLGTGDCEDMAILGSRLLSSAGYDVAVIEIADHVGIGVNTPFKGDFFKFKNNSYYYLELTGTNYDLGELPEEYSGFSARLFNPQEVILDPSWKIQRITVANASVYNVSVTFKNNFTGLAIGYIAYENFSGNVSLKDSKEERRVNFILPVLPSLDHRLILEFRGVSANTVFLQTPWVTEY